MEGVTAAGGEGYITNPNPPNPFVFVGTVFTVYDYVFFAVFATRYVLELGTVLLCIIQMFMIRASEESTPLLANGTNNATTYGTSTSNQQQQPNASKDKSAFSNFFAKMRRLLPYIWPHKSRWLQFLVLVCFSLMLLGLGVNALTPLQIGRVVDGLGEGKGKAITRIKRENPYSHSVSRYICMGCCTCICRLEIPTGWGKSSCKQGGGGG